MNVIRVKRTKIRRTASETLSRRYFANEENWENAIEVLLFAIIVAISTWQICVAVGSLNEFLERAVS